MILKFTYGFNYKGFLFGWNKGELYRLPIYSNGRSYGLKKLNVIDINGKKGYRIKRDKKTIKPQLEEMTERINYIYTINGKDSDDTPF